MFKFEKHLAIIDGEVMDINNISQSIVSLSNFCSRWNGVIFVLIVMCRESGHTLTINVALHK